LVLVRGAVVVVATPDVSDVERRVVVPDVAEGVAADGAAEAVAAVGRSGAAAFCTCVAANALMPPSDETVTAVASPRRIRLERISGADVPRRGGRRCATTSRTPLRAPQWVSFV
jgi:hypothetical protein